MLADLFPFVGPLEAVLKVPSGFRNPGPAIRDMGGHAMAYSQRRKCVAIRGMYMLEGYIYQPQAAWV